MRKLCPDQVDAVLRAARPLASADQEPFFKEVSSALADLSDLGDGVVHRIIRDVQHRYWGSPNLGYGSTRWR